MMARIRTVRWRGFKQAVRKIQEFCCLREKFLARIPNSPIFLPVEAASMICGFFILYGNHRRLAAAHRARSLARIGAGSGSGADSQGRAGRASPFAAGTTTFSACAAFKVILGHFSIPFHPAFLQLRSEMCISLRISSAVFVALSCCPYFTSRSYSYSYSPLTHMASGRRSTSTSGKGVF